MEWHGCRKRGCCRSSNVKKGGQRIGKIVVWWVTEAGGGGNVGLLVAKKEGVRIWMNVSWWFTEAEGGGDFDLLVAKKREEDLGGAWGGGVRRPEEWAASA